VRHGPKENRAYRYRCPQQKKQAKSAPPKKPGELNREGMKAARARGVRSGPKPKLSRQQIDHARKLIGEGKRREDVADLFKVSRTTLYRAFAVKDF
jgi:AraC-like DNA-binding protein